MGAPKFVGEGVALQVKLGHKTFFLKLLMCGAPPEALCQGMRPT